MRNILRWLWRGALVSLLIILAAGIWKREEITRLMAVNSLFSEGRIVDNFSNMNTAFLSVPVSRGDGPVSELPYGPEAFLPNGVNTWIKERSVTALVILKKGEVVYENYFLGTTNKHRRIGWSISKSYLSALVGILLAEGKIDSLDDPVTKYAPQLKGGAYDGATLLNVLQMTSGVTFDEDYLDKNSDINRMGRVLALGREMDTFAAELTETFAAPGEGWKYVSIDTHIIGMVVRGATGRSIADLMSEKVIAPLGLEDEPYYLTDGVGTAFVLGGINMTTRDFARFGQMYLQGGMWQGQQIVPADWVTASTRPSAPTAEGEIQYGYQWWIPRDGAPGEYMARGIYGQYVYIDTAREVVIATNAADRQFRDQGVAQSNTAIFRRIAEGI